MALALICVLLLLCLCCTLQVIVRSNNSPAATLLPRGEYQGEIETLYRFDMVLDKYSREDRISLAKLLLMFFPLGNGKHIKLHFQKLVVSDEDLCFVCNAMGLTFSEAVEKNAYVFTRKLTCPCKALELLLFDEVHEMSQKQADEKRKRIEAGQRPLAATTFRRTAGMEKIGGKIGLHLGAGPRVSHRSRDAKSVSASLPQDPGERDEEEGDPSKQRAERRLVRVALDEIQQGKASRSLRTRAQRIWDMYRRDYRPFKIIKVRLIVGGYGSVKRIGKDQEVHMLSTCASLLQNARRELSGNADEGAGSGKRLHVWRNGYLEAIEPQATLLASGLKPPAIKLFLA